MALPTTDRRVAPRRELHCPISLVRPSRGSALTAETVDVGTGGMRICCGRPLSIDEFLQFDLDLGDGHVEGRARVLRDQGRGVYALRFERLGPGCQERLARLVAT